MSFHMDTNPASLISSLFRSDYSDTTTANSSSASSSSFSFPEQPRKRRRSMHEEYRSLLEQGKLHLQAMDNAEPFITWVMEKNKKVAIYCKVCEKFLGPNKGGSFFTHVRTCKNQINGVQAFAPITEQQKEEFSYTVVDAIGKDLNLFTQLNTEAFKQCIQKALIIGFESKQPGYGPPDASELFNNDNMQSFGYENEVYTDESNHSKNNILNVIKNEEPSKSSPIMINGFGSTPSDFGNNMGYDRRASTLGEAIFNENEFTDITLVASDGKEITAHRCFLSHASPIWKGIFETKAKNFAKMNIEFDSNVTIRALQYCYGADQFVDGYESQLLEFAKVYEIQDLKERCLLHLDQNVDPGNVCEIIQLAYEHNYEALKQKCIRTVVENKDLVGKEKINSLPPPILCDILFAQ